MNDWSTFLRASLHETLQLRRQLKPLYPVAWYLTRPYATGISGGMMAPTRGIAVRFVLLGSPSKGNEFLNVGTCRPLPSFTVKIMTPRGVLPKEEPHPPRGIVPTQETAGQPKLAECR